MEPHRYRRDHAQRAIGTCQQLHQVVARDVLDNLAAAVGDSAVGQCHADADDQIACSAVADAQWTTGVGGNDAAQRRLFGPGWIERQHLAMLSQRCLEGRKRHACLDGRGHIAVRVFEQPVQRWVERMKSARCGRLPQPCFGTATTRYHGEFLLGRDA